MIPLLLLVTLLFQAGDQVLTDAIVVRIAGGASADLRRGIEFGIAEMAHTARLMRRQVVLATDGFSAPTAIIVATASAPIPTGETVVRIHASPLPTGAESCEFSVAPPDSKTEVTAWHPSLTRYGASELNDRFARRFAAGMNEGAYLGWVAVKAIVEAELRRSSGENLCQAVAALRFDGHKGRALNFDPSTRTLSQPLYTIRAGKVVGETR